tara:strand:- start:69 stop:749 length:681 start_codon:yes stop_codon:yes gene_type:complete
MKRGNLQQGIVLRRTPPSLNSIAEGQIVFALNPNKGLNMYTKQAGQIFTSSFHKQREDQIIDDLEVRGRATFLKDIVGQGNISGTQVYIFAHSFEMSDQGGGLGYTAKVYLPWNATTEKAAITTGFYDQFIAPYSGRLIKVMARPETASLTTIVGFHKSSDGTVDPNTTATEDITVEISAANTTMEFAFTSAASFDKGDTIALSFNPETNPNQAKISSAWLFDITI